MGGTVLTQQAGTSTVLLLNLQHDVEAAFCQGRVPGGEHKAGCRGGLCQLRHVQGAKAPRTNPGLLCTMYAWTAPKSVLLRVFPML